MKRRSADDASTPSHGGLISLFSGAGGLDRGLEMAGFQIGMAWDRDPVAVQTYNGNRPGVPRAHVADLGDATPADLLDQWEAVSAAPPLGIVGGPPCQPFSLGNVHRIEDDPRARMPLTFAAVLDAAVRRYDDHPRFFLMENVAGLTTRPHRELLAEILKRFRETGFHLVEPFLLDAQDFGVAQRRRRFFLIGFKSEDDRDRFQIPAGDPWTRRTVREAIGDLPEPMPFARGHRPEELGLHPNHWCMNPKSEKFRNGRNEPGNHLGRSFRMLHWDEPSQTVAFGHREVAVHPSGRRRISVLEAMRLQGFGDDYVLKGTLTDQIRLVSDCVPPPLAETLGRAVIEVLGSGAAEAHCDTTGHAQHDVVRTRQTVAATSSSA